MTIDNLQQYVQLRRELTRERDELSRRLAQINEALGAVPASQAAPSQEVAVKAAPVSKPSPKPIRSAAPAGGRAASGASLRELVIEVLSSGPKTKEEVLDLVQKRGYRFQTKDPLNSLGVILYGKNPKFGRVDGKFALPSGGASSRPASAKPAQPVVQKSGSAKRTLSPAARKAIAAAARKRWAAAKAAGKKRL